ncbi:MAG: hypothetical protein AB7T86_17385 [Xanthobacteraceae bacterium]|uniref:hypothetical protein n=1 Tax=Pseudolabrys sp. TaxID=1960880 RepID=UPI003D0BAF03
MKHIIAFIAAIMCSLSTASAEDGPFGLKWGSSVEEIRTSGVELKDFSSSEFGRSFVATKLNKALSDQDTTLLSFGYDNKLWRIVAVSRSYENDPYGNSVKSRYKELSDVLSSKYGKGKTSHHLGRSIYSEPQYFLAGIRGGDSNWFTNFDAGRVFIQLGLSASDSSTGRWRMIFEHKDGRRSFEDGKRSQEKGSL